ncbi:MAG: general secretion pathway protein GspB [PVC group bacterium]|nr:general secretion pathway protein GspB [PVC group bacterium]
MRKTFAILLTVIFIFSLAASIDAAPKKSKKKSKKETSKNIGKKQHGAIKYTGFEAKRDPFGVPAIIEKMLLKPDIAIGAGQEEVIKLPSIFVQGIIWSKRRPQAIVDNNVLKVGDYIKEFEIKEIKRKSIELFYKGKTFSVPVAGTSSTSKSKSKK